MSSWSKANTELTGPRSSFIVRTNRSFYDDESPQRREVGHTLGPALDALNDFALNDLFGKQMVSWLRRRWPMILFCDQQAFMSDAALRVSMALFSRTIKFGKLVEHVSADQLFYGIVEPQVEPDGKRRRKSKTRIAAESPFLRK